MEMLKQELYGYLQNASEAVNQFTTKADDPNRGAYIVALLQMQSAYMIATQLGIIANLLVKPARKTKAEASS